MGYEIGYKAWLNYARVEDQEMSREYRKLSELIYIQPGSDVMNTAILELTEGIKAITGQPSQVGEAHFKEAGILLGIIGKNSELDNYLEKGKSRFLHEDGYYLRSVIESGRVRLVLLSLTESGILYGVFHLLRMMQSEQRLDSIHIVENSQNRLRMINQWDNMDGSIERGYAGSSIFYQNGEFVSDLSRIRDYARLLASISINAIVINNVNVHERETRLITEELLPKVSEVSKIFKSHGITLFLSINFASPYQIGGLDTADPIDENVCKWWKQQTDLIYKFVPDFGGFLVKADSEFRPGPFTYGRDHADGANMLADVLLPHGGLVIWRCFVYNCLQDWQDRKTDRARAAFDHFTPLDGRFKENVLLQIKNGPMDFQVREPVSPLLGALSQTNQLLELQITQEYTGQQKHLCYLVPQWKEVVDFDTYARGKGTTVAEISSGKAFGRSIGGFAAVSNIGDDLNWTGHPLAQANLYGFGRLCWNPKLTAEEIAKEWTILTFGRQEETVNAICSMLMDSWPIYESYNAPLGVGWMVNPHHHYGPNVDGYEYSKWGTYHFADCNGIGVDRTLGTGTGFSAQYRSPQSNHYEILDNCPDDLLLFFHHVPYTHKLKSGKTVIQHIYDSHFEGAERANDLVSRWELLKKQIDESCYMEVLERLLIQSEHAKEWRDVINTYFLRKSGIPDAHQRDIY